MAEEFTVCCPACQKSSVARFIYGMPNFDDEEFMAKVHEKKIVLGGCVFTQDAPRWLCNECGHKWA